MSGEDPWLVVIDPQRIFADPTSDWCAPRFDEIVPPIDRLATAFGERVVVTRWLPSAVHEGSWGEYFQRWTFADRPADDPLFDLVDAARGWVRRPTLDVTTFGKWGPGLTAVTGPTPHLVLAGVATDCCVVSTALAAADAGAWVQVVPEAVAGSDDTNQAAALQVMGLFGPQIEVIGVEELLAAR